MVDVEENWSSGGDVILEDLGVKPRCEGSSLARNNSGGTLSSIVEQYRRGEVFSFSSFPHADVFSEDVAKIIFTFASCEQILAMSLVCNLWFDISKSAVVCTMHPSMVFTSARQTLRADVKPLVKKVRGKDCLDEDAVSHVLYLPYDFRLIPSYGPYAHRRLKFVFAQDAFVLHCVLLHPYGKIIAGKTHFYLTELAFAGVEIHLLLEHLTALMHMSPSCWACDTSVCSQYFKLVDGTRARRPEMFESQRGEPRMTTPSVGPSFGFAYTLFPCDQRHEKVSILMPVGVCVAELRCALHEHLKLGYEQGVLLVGARCQVLDDWNECPPEATFIQFATCISEKNVTLPHLTQHNGQREVSEALSKQGKRLETLDMMLVSPDVGGGIVKVRVRQTMGMLKKAILNTTDDCNGIVMVQSRPGVIADDGEEHTLDGYAPHVFYDGGVLLAYIATSFVNVKAISCTSSATITMAVNRCWTVRSFLHVLYSALRRLSHYPPNDTVWCGVEHRDAEEVPFPSRVSIFSSTVCIGNGPFLKMESHITDYWTLPEQDRIIFVHCVTGCGE